MAAKLKKGDSVIVLSGRDKGKRGVVLEVYPKEGKALVEGINTVFRHTKPTNTAEGGILQKALPIRLCKLSYFDVQSGKATRIGFSLQGDKMVRVSKRTGEPLNV